MSYHLDLTRTCLKTHIRSTPNCKRKSSSAPQMTMMKNFLSAYTTHNPSFAFNRSNAGSQLRKLTTAFNLP